MYFAFHHYKYKENRKKHFGEENMTRKKTFFIFIATLILSFNFNNISFAIQDIEQEYKYPDYAYEFAGKDTCENFNRKIFIFNSKVNKYVIRPVNIVWASILPKYGMDRIQNLYNNIEFPIRLVSCLLQKDFKSSKTETVRFLTNTTLGIGGLYDPAKDRFKIEPRQEDMGQALAHFKVKRGPYLVLPVVAFGNLRDIAGQILDCPLNPTSYVIGPIAMAAKSVLLLNQSSYTQSLIKAINDGYADPYDITKKLCGVEKYIKCSNLDRKEILAEKTASQNIVKVNTITDDSNISDIMNANLKADIKLNDYNPQNPTIDSLRTALFDDKTLSDPIWSDLSIWNKTFGKKIKTDSISVDKKCPNYKYRYILQTNKNAPLAILYPSVGEGIMSYHSVVLAKILYDKGYSVVIQGSAFQWEFAKSMPDDYKPGYPAKDASYLRLVSSKIINNLESKKACHFEKKILVGTSFGALTALFVAAQEENDNTLGISNYISINPPIEILFALKQVDKYTQDWQNNSDDIKLRSAITAEKVLQTIQNVSNKKSTNLVQNESAYLPFTDEEAKLIIGFIMKQKLSDLVFTIEHCSTAKKSDLYETINNMSYNDYAKKYLLIDNYGSVEKLKYDTSLYSLANFLQKNENYKIYHSCDDYFVNHEQLAWLKKQTNDKSVFFSNGSHLGVLYRKEFLDEFKKDVTLSEATPENNLETLSAK